MDIFLKSGNILFFILIAAIAAAVAYVYYRKSTLESPKKYVFPAIRFFSTLFILLLFLTPVLSFISSDAQLHKNIFLIDASKSLEIENRFNGEQSILNDKIPSDNSFFAFSDGVIKEIRKNDFDSIQKISNHINSTNLLKSISSLSSFQDMNSVTILSDGNINEGGNPTELAKSFNIPFSYILIGDTTQKRDVLVKNIYVNNTAFIDSKVSVRVELNSYKINEGIKVNLFEEETQIDSKTIQTNDKNNLYEADFLISSGTEGIKKYKIEIEPLKDEITLKNNTDYFFINYLNNKFKVLVYSGGPSSDFAFLKEQLSSINNFQVTYQTQKSPAEFYEPAVNNYKDYDAIIFAGFPVVQTNASVVNELKSSIDKYKTPLIYIESRNVDYSKLSIFKDNLPMTVISSSNNEVESQLKLISNSNSEFLKNTDLNSINSSPAIFVNSNSYSVKPGAETILTNSKNSQPVVVIANSDEKGSAAFLFHGFYKLRLNKQNDFSLVFSKLLSSSIISISSKDKKKIMDFELSKNIVGPGDEVTLIARLKNYEDISVPSVKVKINSKDFSKELELSKISSDYFEGKFTPDFKGDFKISAELFSNGNSIETSSARLLSDENNLEFKKTNADRTILSEISAATNGRNFSDYSKNQIQSYLDSLSSSQNLSTKSRKDFSLKFNPYFLSLVIFTLCLEWFLRKRNNLS
ncbi:MAG: hypothetical protein JST55_00155 [Bacteroidetes bacterium]|nr:hypothetical protein [Bacteroidota bacterium]